MNLFLNSFNISEVCGTKHLRHRYSTASSCSASLFSLSWEHSSAEIKTPLSSLQILHTSFVAAVFCFLWLQESFSAQWEARAGERNSESFLRFHFPSKSSRLTAPRMEWAWRFSSNSAGGQFLSKSDPKSVTGVQPLPFHWVGTSHAKDLAHTEEPSVFQTQSF